MTIIHPHKIVHLNMLEQYNALECIKSASRVLSMKPGEEALLIFYCAHSSGFRPSVSFISGQTGLDKRSILRNRRHLEEDGLIAVTDSVIYVDWSRIRLFASLDARMVPKQRSKRRIAPVNVRRGGATFTDAFLLRCYTMPVSSLCRMLSSMPEEDYPVWKSSMLRMGKKISRM